MKRDRDFAEVKFAKSDVHKALIELGVRRLRRH
jgi:hypothetical protein